MTPRDELLERIYRRGDRIRRRTQLAVLTPLTAVLLMLGLVAAAVEADGGSVTVEVADTTTTAPAPGDSTTTEAPTTTAAPTTTTTTAPAPPPCTTFGPGTSTRHGRHPDNQPVVVTACVVPRVRAGQPVTLRVDAHDPDAPLPAELPDGGCSGSHGVEWNGPRGCGIAASCPAQEPPQPPPPPREGRATYTLTHTYDRPGVYEISIEIHSGEACQFDWSDAARLSIRVEVT